MSSCPSKQATAGKPRYLLHFLWCRYLCGRGRRAVCKATVDSSGLPVLASACGEWYCRCRLVGAWRRALRARYKDGCPEAFLQDRLATLAGGVVGPGRFAGVPSRTPVEVPQSGERPNMQVSKRLSDSTPCNRRTNINFVHMVKRIAGAAHQMCNCVHWQKRDTFGISVVRSWFAFSGGQFLRLTKPTQLKWGYIQHAPHCLE